MKFNDASVKELQAKTLTFLKEFGQESILGEESAAVLGSGNAQSKFENLLKSTGYENNPTDFFDNLKEQLRRSGIGATITIGEVELPYLYLLFVLEILLPGHGMISVDTVERLENLTNIKLPKTERADMQKVLDKYPVRFSHHILRQMRISNAVAYQYFPFVDELSTDGLVNTWVGQFHDGPLEQMYENRPILVLNMDCPVYCRFCFRKHKETRTRPAPTNKEIHAALDNMRRQPNIKEVLLTGGDPFMNMKTLKTAAEGIMDIDPIRTLRIATRSIAYYPHLFFANNQRWLNYLMELNANLQGKGKKLEIATHFLHPDEVSLDSLKIISELVGSGIPVYVQTPYIKDCNEGGEALTRLYNKLRGAGAEMHYIFKPCTPLQGNKRYVPTSASGIKTVRYLRAHLSDRAIPHVCTATAIGKIDWFTSGWPVERVADDSRYIWLRTPYTPEYFLRFCPEFDLGTVGETQARINPEGTVDIKYRVDIGDDGLFVGTRHPVEFPEHVTDLDKLKQLQAAVMADQRLGDTVVPAAALGITRLHKVKVEIDLDTDNIDYEYIMRDKSLTDVIIASKGDIVDSIDKLEEVVKELSRINHVNAIRLRSFKFTYEPRAYKPEVISKLGALNKLSLVQPKRVEIETRFLHATEAKPEHADLVKELGKYGITVYNNTPLLAGINDDEKEIEKIMNHCRDSGIEVNNVFIGGTALQQKHGQPVDASKVINIASYMRLNGSGRELPKYVLTTPFGNVDFGISTQFFIRADKTHVVLLPYDRNYFESFSTGFKWEHDLELAGGHPVIKVDDLTFNRGFMLGIDPKIARESISDALSAIYIVPVLPFKVKKDDMFVLDLTSNNPELQSIDPKDPVQLGQYVNGKLSESGARVGIGSYGEHRTIYRNSPLFKNKRKPERIVHLGMDLFVAEGTAINAPLKGRVHSFKENKKMGDYGPTVILEHEVLGVTFYTLYGHVSRETLSRLKVGQEIDIGETFAEVGSTKVNGNWPPHLHFQIILAIGKKKGDFPGVSSKADMETLMQNSPDPNLLLRMPL